MRDFKSDFESYVTISAKDFLMKKFSDVFSLNDVVNEKDDNIKTIKTNANNLFVIKKTISILI